MEEKIDKFYNIQGNANTNVICWKLLSTKVIVKQLISTDFNCATHAEKNGCTGAINEVYLL